MKLGKAKLKRILSDETGIPIKDTTCDRQSYHCRDKRQGVRQLSGDPGRYGRCHL